LSFPGLDLAALMKSPRVLYSDWLLTTKTRSNVPAIETIAKSFVGSNGRLWKVAALMAAPLVTHAIVEPSGGEVSTGPAAALPPGPGIFSSSTGWLSVGVNL